MLKVDSRSTSSVPFTLRSGKDLDDNLVLGGAVDAAIKTKSNHKDASIHNEPT